MNDDLHNIDDLFRKALEDNTDLPSSAVWDNIDKRLDKKKVVSISKRYNKLKWAAAILLLFSVGLAMYTLNMQVKNKELIKQNNAIKDLKARPAQETNSENKKRFTNDGSSKKETNDTSLIAGDKTGLPVNNTIADNIKQTHNKLGDDNSLKLQPKEKTDEHTQHQKQLLKNKSATKIKTEIAVSDSDNVGKKNLVGLVVHNNKPQPSNIRQPQDLNDFILTKESYATGVPITFEVKDMLKSELIKSLPQINKVITNNTDLVKNIKSTSTKQRNIKNVSSSLLSATLFYSPDIVFRDVKEGHPRFREDERHQIEKDEQIKSSSTYGVLLDIKPLKNWVLESGLTFSTKNTNIQPKTIFARPDDNGNIHYRYNCSAGYSFITLKSPGQPVSGDSVKALPSKNTLQYIGVPLTIKYSISKGKFTLMPGVGISANFLTKGKLETTIATTTGNESAVSNDIHGLKSSYFNGLASLAAQYKLNKTFAITFMPTARFALSSINKDAPVKTDLNSLGLAGGVIIKF